MEKADTLREVLIKKQSALDLTQSMVDEEITMLDQRATECQKQLQDVSIERKQLSANIDEDTLSLYERLMKSKGSDAVVSAGTGQCGGCHMKLIPSTMMSVQAGKDLTQCENCGRILYIS
jgi:predicted  nucleic acid-binding Zn-ribbon protein